MQDRIATLSTEPRVPWRRDLASVSRPKSVLCLSNPIQLVLVALCSLLTSNFSPALASPSLADGESLTYRVGWGILGSAGEIKVSARTVESKEGTPQLQVNSSAATRGFGRILYSFTAAAEAIFDGASGHLLAISETSKSSGKETSTTLVPDYTKSVAIYTNKVEPEKNAVLTMPPGEPLDLIMTLIQTRQWQLEPGEQKDALVLLGHVFYELTVHALAYEEIHTPLGSFRTLVLEPRMEKTPPRGMFKRGATVRVWISQEGRRLPVKFTVKFKIGTGVATLIDYQPPTR